MKTFATTASVFRDWVLLEVLPSLVGLSSSMKESSKREVMPEGKKQGQILFLQSKNRDRYYFCSPLNEAEWTTVKNRDRYHFLIAGHDLRLTSCAVRERSNEGDRSVFLHFSVWQEKTGTDTIFGHSPAEKLVEQQKLKKRIAKTAMKLSGYNQPRSGATCGLRSKRTERPGQIRFSEINRDRHHFCHNLPAKIGQTQLFESETQRSASVLRLAREISSNEGDRSAFPGVPPLERKTVQSPHKNRDRHLFLVRCSRFLVLGKR